MDMETWKHGKMETHRNMEKWNNGDMYLKTWCVASFHNGDNKKKTETEALAKFSSIHLLFAHRANGSLSFVRLLMKKQTEVISLSWEGASPL
jgi:hypothetical protein